MAMRTLGYWLAGLLLLGCGGGNDDKAAGSGAGSAGVGAAGSGGAHSGGAHTGGAHTGGTSGGGTTSGGADTAGAGNTPALDNCTIFPADNAWNIDVSELPVHARSDAYVDAIGRGDHVHPDFGTEWEGAPIGIPYTIVGSDQAPLSVDYTDYGDESDPGPFPIPLDAAVEGGPDSDGDRHVLAIDTAACRLYELGGAYPAGDHWEAAVGVEWDLTRNDTHPPGCTSVDAAGLPIFPGLVRYDEVVEQGAVHHAVRFTVSETQRAYVAPASHYASDNTDPDLPPMGLRFRMKADYDCSGYSSEAQVICDGLKRYGMIVADNGSNWYISGAPDSRWNDEALADLGNISGDAFEVVDTGATPVTDAPDCVF